MQDPATIQDIFFFFFGFTKTIVWKSSKNYKWAIVFAKLTNELRQLMEFSYLTVKCGIKLNLNHLLKLF